MKELVCIVCPMGCRLQVDEANDFSVSGNRCPRGAEYGRRELTAPTRVVTGTVVIRGAAIPRLPVKTSGEIPKDLVRSAAAALNGVIAQAPVQRGDVVLRNVCSSGVDFIATRDLPSADF